MSADGPEVDALFAIANNIEKLRSDIEHQLKRLVGQLEDMNGYLAQIDKAMPNPLDVPE